MLNALIICYLFLGGVGSGAFLILNVMSYLSPRVAITGYSHKYLQSQSNYQRLFGAGNVACLLVQLLGILCLLFDLGRPDRILLFVTDLHLSVVSIGAYALAVLIACSLFLSISWICSIKVRTTFVRIINIVGMLASCVVMVYTALLLQSFSTMEFWHSPFVLILFVLSSLSTGIAYLYLVAQFSGSLSEFSIIFMSLRQSDTVLMMIEMLFLAVFLYVSHNGELTRIVVEELLFGSLANLFWVGLVLFGLVIPLMLNVLSVIMRLNLPQEVPPLLILFGGVCLRICIVAAVY